MIITKTYGVTNFVYSTIYSNQKGVSNPNISITSRFGTTPTKNLCLGHMNSSAAIGGSGGKITSNHSI